jgi:hypothetical protein
MDTGGYFSGGKEVEASAAQVKNIGAILLLLHTP